MCAYIDEDEWWLPLNWYELIQLCDPLSFLLLSIDKFCAFHRSVLTYIHNFITTRIFVFVYLYLYLYLYL